MVIRMLLKRNTYYDSIALMSIAQAMREQAGVEDAGAMMATEANRALMRDAGLLPDELTEQQRVFNPDDLLIAVRAEDEAHAQAALTIAEQQLDSQGERDAQSSGTKARLRSLEVALRHEQPDQQANLAVISVAGEHAWLEAEQALRHGLHVFLFSNNVSIEEERRLKILAESRGLLLMGPDCGTAILNGVGLGFSNVVARGSIGIVGASGTGMQQLICLLAAAGLGISQAIGTGGRDLSEAIGGVMMRRGLALLAADADTEVIVLVAKPSSERVVHDILALAAQVAKPVVAVFLSATPEQFQASGNVTLARTLTAGAEQAVSLAVRDQERVPGKEAILAQQARLSVERSKLISSQKYVRALYSGGTLCYEAMLSLSEHLGAISSNIPLDAASGLNPGEQFRGHTALDLGVDEFTQGRPHPMIDPTLRLQYLRRAAEDPETAVILFDIVLGFCSHPDPALVYAPVIAQLRGEANAAGRGLPVIVSLCGTEGDPQRLSAQRATLEAAGALVFESNSAAALATAAFVDSAAAML